MQEETHEGRLSLYEIVWPGGQFLYAACSLECAIRWSVALLSERKQRDPHALFIGSSDGPGHHRRN